MFATLTHAISSTKATAPSRSSSELPDRRLRADPRARSTQAPWPRLRVGILLLEQLADAVHVGARLLERHAGLQPRVDGELMAGARLSGCGPPSSASGAQRSSVSSGNSNVCGSTPTTSCGMPFSDSVRPTIARIAIRSASSTACAPRMHDAMLAGDAFVGAERAAEHRAYAQHVEERRRHDADEQPDRLARRRSDRRASVVIAAMLRSSSFILAQSSEVRRRDDVVDARLRPGASPTP